MTTKANPERTVFDQRADVRAAKEPMCGLPPKKEDDATQIHVDLINRTAEAVREEKMREHYGKFNAACDKLWTVPPDVETQSHYVNDGVEPIDLIRSLGILAPFCRGNILKYVSRYDRKGGLEDLKKAQVYLQWLIEEVEGE